MMSSIMNEEKTNCRNCIYYYVTWDVKFPYGCKLFGVKSKQMPCIIVYQSIGRPCERFTKKQK
jgi:hypothetical protein